MSRRRPRTRRRRIESNGRSNLGILGYGQQIGSSNQNLLPITPHATVIAVPHAHSHLGLCERRDHQDTFMIDAKTEDESTKRSNPEMFETRVSTYGAYKFEGRHDMPDSRAGATSRESCVQCQAKSNRGSWFVVRDV